MSRGARLVPVLALAAGLALGLWTLFGPTYSYCSSFASSTDTTTTTVCGTANLVTAQAGNLFPAPLLFIAAWALAPALAVIGTRSGSRGFALAMTAVAFGLDLTSIVSLGGGFVFALLVAPLLLLALVLIASGRRDPAPTSLR